MMPANFHQMLIAAALMLVPARLPFYDGAGRTTEAARQLVLERIDAIARTGHCRQAFGQEKIDMEHVRRTALQARFYNAEGSEGYLKVSYVVGRPASPDQRLRDLARAVSADAFVLGYQQGQQYVRTRHVVLARGYFGQGDAEAGTWRPTTRDEKQALLLHEILHIALNVGDDDLDRRDLCPLRLLAFCPRSPAAAAGVSE